MLHTTFVEGAAPPLLPDCRTVVDLGGNIGLSTIYLARHFRGARFYVVEAVRENAEALRRNLAPLGDRVQIDHAAVWRSNEPVFIRPPEHAGSYGAFRCVSDGKGESVQGFTMASILERSGFERVDLVKMDIEGAEAGVFAEADWLNRVNALSVEFHGNARSESDFDAVIARRGMRIAAELPNRGVLAVRSL
jgi:FkbM family methyltransferase